jgi:hypothetical protein
MRNEKWLGENPRPVAKNATRTGHPFLNRDPSTALGMTIQK